MFKYKIKAISAHRAWMKCPEELENCSTGFAFPVMADDAEVLNLRTLLLIESSIENRLRTNTGYEIIDCQGKVMKMKFLHFYRAEDESLCKRS